MEDQTPPTHHGVRLIFRAYACSSEYSSPSTTSTLDGGELEHRDDADSVWISCYNVSSMAREEVRDDHVRGCQRGDPPHPCGYANRWYFSVSNSRSLYSTKRRSVDDIEVLHFAEL